MTLAGCSNVETLNGVAQVAAEVQAAESQTPYATVEELDAITNGTTEYVYWRVARTFALMELESFRTENGWDGAKLSTLPVLVYDSMSRPKYYEYRVILDDREIGAITCVAQKRDGGPTAYVLPSPSDYSQVKTKGAEYRIVANGYPRVAFKRASQTERGVKLLEDDNSISGEISPDLVEYILLYPFLFTNETMGIDDVIQSVTSNVEHNESMWNQFTNDWSNFTILSTNDEFIAYIFGNEQTKAIDWDGGRALDGFTGTYPGTNWWYNKSVTYESNGILNWHKSPSCIKDINGEGVIWCGPSAGAMLLNYYAAKENKPDYIAKVKYYDTPEYFYATKDYDQLFVTNITFTIGSDGLQYTSFRLQYHYYNTVDKPTCPVEAYTTISPDYSMDVGFETKGTNFRSYYGYWTSVIDVKATLKGYKQPPVVFRDFPFSIRQVVKFGNFHTNISMQYLSYNNKRLMLSNRYAIQDGYDTFGRLCGITNFMTGESQTSKIKEALEWATDEKLRFCIRSDVMRNIELRYTILSSLIEKGDMAIDNRYGYTFDTTTTPERSGHYRIALGYKCVMKKAMVAKIRETRIVTKYRNFFPMIQRVRETYYALEDVPDTKWILLTDGNGGERTLQDMVPNLFDYRSTNREFMKYGTPVNGKKITTQIFWENIKQNLYRYGEIIYRARELENE